MRSSRWVNLELTYEGLKVVEGTDKALGSGTFRAYL